MNTLPKMITAQLLGEPTAYQALRSHWSQMMNSDRRHELTAAHHLLYSVLLGKDWRRGFTFVTNDKKLANGAYPSWGLFRALRLFHSQYHHDQLLAPFDNLITLATLRKLRALVPTVNPYHYGPDRFAAIRFPFDAYSVPEAILPLPAADQESFYA